MRGKTGDGRRETEGIDTDIYQIIPVREETNGGLETSCGHEQGRKVTE
ncbi:hypothetical protein [Algoriphagus hitonicola]